MFFLSGSLIGCGYFYAGTWEDDPGNWNRIFRTSEPPPGIKLIHSWYSRAPHFTYEFEYFAMLEVTEEARQGILDPEQLEQVKRLSEQKELTHFFHEKPKWFLPKPLESYQVWVFQKEPKQHYRVFVDKKTGVVFLTDFQY